MPSPVRRNPTLALAVALALLASTGAAPAAAKPGDPDWHRVRSKGTKAKAQQSSWRLVRQPKRAKKSTRKRSTPPAAARRYAERVGFTSHTSYMTEEDGHALLSRAAGIGVHWIREDFNWALIEARGKGLFDWSSSDRVMRNAARLGINVLAVADYTPAWANGGRSDDKYPPLNPRDYADFVVAVANRYGRRGTFWKENPTLPARPLAAIELWNEPWLWIFWKPQPDPARYAALVRAAAPAIKAVHPEIDVLVSGDLQLGYSDGRDYTGGTHRNWEHGFLARLLSHDFAFESVDGYSVHAYSEKFGPYQTSISWFADQTFAQQWLYQRLVLTRDMLRKARKFRPLWNTEFGWSTSGDVDEPTQAAYIEGALKRAVVEWSSFVERSFIFVLAKPHNADRDGGYNLFRDDMTPKPAWFALERLLADRS